MATNRYQHSIPPEDYRQLLEYVERELASVSASIDSLATGEKDVLHNPPIRVFPGLKVIADGTDWDPDGSGIQGEYLYTENDEWVRIGPTPVVPFDPTSLEDAIDALDVRVTDLEAEVADLDSRITALEDYGPTTMTPVATTSGSTQTLTGIPAGLDSFLVIFNGISSNGTGAMTLQVGTSAGLVTTGYSGNRSSIAAASAGGALLSTSVILMDVSVAASLYYGVCRFNRVSGNSWIFESRLCNDSGTVRQVFSTGQITTPDELDRVALITANTWDAGEFTVKYHNGIL